MISSTLQSQLLRGRLLCGNTALLCKNKCINPARESYALAGFYMQQEIDFIFHLKFRQLVHREARYCERSEQ